MDQSLLTSPASSLVQVLVEEVGDKGGSDEEESVVDHNDGQILCTMEWSMVFVKVPL